MRRQIGDGSGLCATVTRNVGRAPRRGRGKSEARNVLHAGSEAAGRRAFPRLRHVILPRACHIVQLRESRALCTPDVSLYSLDPLLLRLRLRSP